MMLNIQEYVSLKDLIIIFLFEKTSLKLIKNTVYFLNSLLQEHNVSLMSLC